MMSVSLLPTKFYVPPPQSDLVSRPRLVQRLVDGLAHPLVLISAPAGFGKTTLLSEWHHSPAGSDWPLAWLSLECEDNDPARFLGYLGGALDPLRPGALPLIRENLLPSQSQSALTALLDHLGDLPAPFALILEDYHLITARAIHDAVAFMIQHMPPHMHLILSSRADPPLPLARLRAQGQLTEIRAEHLRFTHEETAAFLECIEGFVLSPEDVMVLEARTEGWISGLKLAALSMQDNQLDDFSDFISRFGGNHHYIADYLMEEVLEGQPEPVRDFLLQTSVSSCLCGSLCDALTRQNNGQAMLEYLEQENLFVVRQDDERRWYRYHHLFAELLRRHFNRVYPGLEPELRRRVAEWYVQNDFMDCAVEEALDAKAFDLAAGWIEQFQPTMIESGQIATLSRWLEALPKNVLITHPALKSPDASSSPRLLTDRERDVLRRIAAGAPNREIAETLVVSLGTVKKHLNNIYAKLGVRSRTQALARARELGLL